LTARYISSVIYYAYIVWVIRNETNSNITFQVTHRDTRTVVKHIKNKCISQSYEQ